MEMPNITIKNDPIFSLQVECHNNSRVMVQLATILAFQKEKQVLLNVFWFINML